MLLALPRGITGRQLRANLVGCRTGRLVPTMWTGEEESGSRGAKWRSVAGPSRTMRPSVVWRHCVYTDCRDAPVDVSGVYQD
jgi:hypothetical protein